MTADFQRFSSDYLLELNLPYPASVVIGSQASLSSQDPNDKVCNNLSRSRYKNKTREIPAEIEAHTGLNSLDAISKNACLKCHRKRCTHVINVCPQPEMSITPEYPLLQSGRITCISCHSPHSSQYAHLTRNFFEKELCIGCHSSKQK
ncbi:MAG: cytochrome c3 family protein [Deltaproteobacteria bacterium]|jgi:predicted CXXCH cytochrome family protein|nr:cytochrome c3 family protein [Deltaproteobacteria bacterium]